MTIKTRRVLARCIECGAEAVSRGDGSSVTIVHESTCSESLPGCDLCGESADEEMGEFYGPAVDGVVVAHATCGLDAGLEIA